VTPARGGGPRAARARRAAQAPAARASTPARNPFADRVALALWLTLALLAAGRAAASLAHDMTWWGLDAQRFLPPLSGGLPWLVMTLALLPVLGAALAPAASRLGDSLVRHPRGAAAIAALLSAAVVLALPDQTIYVGDFAMRSGTILTARDPERLFPQAMALDLLVHVRLPQYLITQLGWTVQMALRGLGALGAAVLALAAVRLPRALGLGGAAALAVAVTVWAGGTLGMFTGYGKSAIELTALTALAGAASLEAVGSGGGLVTLGLCAALALGFHRSGIVLAPLALTGLALAPVPWSRAPRWIGAALVALALALFGPRAIHLIATFDVLHHLAPAETRAAGGMLGSLVDPLHLLDVANVILVLAPLAPLLITLAIVLPRAGSAGAAAPAADPASFRRRAIVLALLVLPALATLLLTRPQQGIFRDRDVFAPAGAALSVLTACAAGAALMPRPRAWLALALVLGAVVPSIQWLALWHQPRVAVAYVRRYIEGPPERAAWDRAATWDYLGTRALVERRGDEAAAAYAKAVQAAQNPRLIGEWGMAELIRNQYARAESLFQRTVELDPNSTIGWNGLATAASWTGDTAACAVAEAGLMRTDPGNPRIAELRALLARARAGK